MKFACMTVITLTRCLSLIALLSAPIRVLALDAAPSTEQANAAYRRALEVELRKEAAKASPSPLVATLLESMKLAAVQGCRTLDAERTACIVELDSPMRAGYEALRFRRDGADWQVLAEPDTPPPQPDIAQAQALVREHLAQLAGRQQDPDSAAEYREYAASLTVSSLEACRLDRDSGAVECDAQLHTPGQGRGSKPLRFELKGASWSLRPE